MAAALIGGRPSILIAGAGALLTCGWLSPTVPPAIAAAQNAHTAHIESRPTHAAYTCDRCHDIDPPEIALKGWDAASRTCTVTCHSNGRGVARPIAWTAGALSCASCHDDETVTKPQMSGQHARHFRVGVACADCHGGIVDRSKKIIDPARHVDGHVDVKILSGRYADGACTPACHELRSW